MTAHSLADEYLSRRAEFDPEAADALGDEPDLLLPELDPETFLRRRDLDDEIRDRLLLIPTAERDPLAAAMIERLGADIALYDSGFTTSLLAPLATPVHRLRQVFDDLPADSSVQRIVTHLQAAARGYVTYAATLLDAARQGHRIAARQTLGMADAVAGWIDPAGTDFYLALARPHGPAAVAAAEATSEAAAEFVDFLRRDLLPAADLHDSVGESMYRTTSAAFLGAEVDLDELYDFGWAELARLGREAEQVARRCTGAGDLDQARALLDDRPGSTVAVGRELVEWLQTRLETTADLLQGTHFDLPARTSRVEARMVTAGSGVMYYTPADHAGSRPGRVWWSVAPGTERVPTWREVTSVHHEGLPGHHLQFAVTAALDLHPWQRSLCHVHGYAEGWAHYAEQLAVELGLVRDDAELLGVLDGQRWRAARIVIDLGLHTGRPIPSGNGITGARAWTPEVAVQFLSRAAGIDPATAEFEVQRYLGWPGQALAFKVGARLIASARRSREQRDGSGFDRTAFHARLLGLGPMGLGPLAETLAASA